MAELVVGDVVVTRFPFSDLTSYKHRPALVLAKGDYDDILLCQITSFGDGELKTIALTDASFTSGGLPVDSYIRPDKIYTADSSLIQRKVGSLNTKSLNKVKQHLRELFGL